MFATLSQILESLFNVVHSTFLKLFLEYCAERQNVNKNQMTARMIVARWKFYIASSHYFSQTKRGLE